MGDQHNQGVYCQDLSSQGEDGKKPPQQRTGRGSCPILLPLPAKKAAAATFPALAFSTSNSRFRNLSLLQAQEQLQNKPQPAHKRVFPALFNPSLAPCSLQVLVEVNEIVAVLIPRGIFGVFLQVFPVI